MLYNKDYHVLQYCNGSRWLALGESPGAGGSGCSNPTAAEGRVIYNVDYGVVQYCDGTNWIATARSTAQSIAGLIHHWALDEAPGATTGVDSVGGANVTLGGTTAFTTSGYTSNALSLPGNGDHASVATPSDMLSQSKLTVSMWFKQYSTSSYLQIGQQNGGGGSTIGMEAYSGALYCGLSGSSQYAGGYIDVPIDTNWHFGALVFDGTKSGDNNRLRCYIDGVPASINWDTSGVPATTTSTALTFNIGAIIGNEANHGTIDDVRVYNTALPDQAIASLYSGTNTYIPVSDCPNIGNTCSDGTIYAGLTPDGNSRMYVTAADAPSTYAWAANGYDVDTSIVNCTAASGSQTGCKTGQANTAILEGLGAGHYPAADYCASLNQNGHSDWYLPAQAELNVLFMNQYLIGISQNIYWSSSERGGGASWGQYFDTGQQDTGNGEVYWVINVRCVRK